MDKRKIDKLGRVTIPKHLRDEYNMHEGHLVSITGGDNELTIRNYEDTNRCLITGKTEGIKMISGIIPLSNEGMLIIQNEIEERLDSDVETI